MRFLLFLLSLFSPALFAQTLPAASSLAFTPPPSDLSVAYLADIFGVVDGVLHGTGSQIMGTMFGVFNAAVLTLGGVVIMYTLIVATLNTAHEGEVMGREWSSPWIPIRSVAGFALMVPKASGYSFIQIFVMWVVVQGIGAADTVWGAAVGYLYRGGVLTQPSAVPTTTNIPAVIFAANVLKAETCMFALNNAMQNYAKQNPTLDMYVPPFVNTLEVVGNNTSGSAAPYVGPPCYGPTCTNSNGTQVAPDTGGVMYFPGSVMVSMGGEQITSQNYEGACGKISWNFTTDYGGGIAGGQNTNQGQIANPANLGASDSRSMAVQQVVSDVQPLAQSLASIIVPPAGSLPTSQTVASWVAANQNNLAYAANDYIGIMAPYLANQNQASGTIAGQLLMASNQQSPGWILAGSYYNQLAQLNQMQAGINSDFAGSAESSPPNLTANLLYNNFTSKSSPDPFKYVLPQDQASLTNATNGLTPTVLAQGSTFSGTNLIDAYGYGEVQNFISLLTASVGGTGTPLPNNTIAAPGSNTASNTGSGFINKSYLGQNIVPGVANWKAVVTFAYDPALLPLYGVLELFNEYVVQTIVSDVNSLTNTTIDPILQISQLGNDIVNGVEKFWLYSTLAVSGASLLAAICAGQSPLIWALITGMLMFIPVMTAIVLAMFVTGATMAYYVPLIPFIVFFFTTLGWFIQVIEAMVAAPLVALGIAHPEGDKMLGQGKHAVMLLVNVFMRPSLIIVGFFAACILSHVALWLLSQGMVIAMPGLQVDWMKLIYVVAVCVIYLYLVLAIINRCFALTHEVPERVLRWIGGQAEAFGEAAAAREISGGLEAGMAAAKGGAEVAGKAPGEFGKELGKGVKASKKTGVKLGG